MTSKFDTLRNKTVLVTGGAGLVGSRIGKFLKGCGAHTICIDPLDAYHFDYRRLFEADRYYDEIIVEYLHSYTSLRALMHNVDFVVHAAACADVAECTHNPVRASEMNLMAAATLFDAMRNASSCSRIVVVSSASVYGSGGDGIVWKESASHSPISSYANAKVWLENEARLRSRESGFEAVILRYFSVYGQPQLPKIGSHSWCVATFTARAQLGLDLCLHGGGHQVRDFVHVDDVARATVLALVGENCAGQTLNVGTGVGTTVRSVAERIRALYGGEPRLVNTGVPTGDPLGGIACTGKAKSVLGFESQIPFELGLRQYVDWFRNAELPEAVFKAVEY
ncbi:MULTISPECIES: NAD-dependent epimerase/dehydratase family protein [Actinomycetaceae]|uniref:UDP-glucose 4-epimerase/dTDP-L-rhamnose 4-epimerase n=1 Tax=Trueperella abortisuis TaxID=445930 RepID=A0ABT9PJ79_9ACTO|nr:MULTISPECIES: NAD-dependent epimerase/dehydratase family protein [Actinomycetaceae]MCI7456885.1 NAD-dependent epimerase/dehydratase family protein [Actinomyces urogenitalis]MDP9832780.1 UDP-glucose 4-epimerase/dTDP-L-rhamnose 4-epimerase [Trueperella abortisuis]